MQLQLFASATPVRVVLRYAVEQSMLRDRGHEVVQPRRGRARARVLKVSCVASRSVSAYLVDRQRAYLVVAGAFVVAPDVLLDFAALESDALVSFASLLELFVSFASMLVAVIR